MSNHVAGVSPVAFSGFGSFQDPNPNPSPPQPTPAVERYRLLIEKGEKGFIYKTLDRTTGEVIRQYPSEEMVRLSQSPAYGPGDVIVTGA
jgi:flagellar protein FlaG